MRVGRQDKQASDRGGRRQGTNRQKGIGETVESSPHVPTVSIGLPVYNGENYLKKTLDSILAQSYTDFELIICDNASTDRTRQICRRFAAKDSRIRYHRQPENLGACANYDMTFHMSRGRYFKWHSHDDLLGPDFLKVTVDILENDPECVLAHTRSARINRKGKETAIYLDHINSMSDRPAERLARWVFPKRWSPFPIFGVIRRSVMERTPLHGDYMDSDTVFLASISLLGKSRIVPETMFFKRSHPERSVRSNTTYRELLAWFGPRKPMLPILKYWRILFGLIDAVKLANLPRKDRRDAYKVLRSWAWLNRADLLLELMLPLYYNGSYTGLGRIVFSETYRNRHRYFPEIAAALRQV